MSTASPDPTPPSILSLSEYFSLVPPAGWEESISFANLPLRLLAYGKILFQPPDQHDVFLKWQIANWLEGQAEWEIFEDVLHQRSKPPAEELNLLYSILLRIRIEFVADYSVVDHPGLGRSLIIDYNYTDWSYKG